MPPIQASPCPALRLNALRALSGLRNVSHGMLAPPDPNSLTPSSGRVNYRALDIAFKRLGVCMTMHELQILLVQFGNQNIATSNSAPGGVWVADVMQALWGITGGAEPSEAEDPLPELAARSRMSVPTSHTSHSMSPKVHRTRTDSWAGNVPGRLL